MVPRRLSLPSDEHSRVRNFARGHNGNASSQSSRASSVQRMEEPPMRRASSAQGRMERARLSILGSSSKSSTSSFSGLNWNGSKWMRRLFSVPPRPASLELEGTPISGVLSPSQSLESFSLVSSSWEGMEKVDEMAGRQEATKRTNLFSFRLGASPEEEDEENRMGHSNGTSQVGSSGKEVAEEVQNRPTLERVSLYERRRDPLPVEKLPGVLKWVSKLGQI